jgi:CRP-like cAMP-binding protein
MNNNLLSRMSAADFKLLEPHLKKFSFKQHTVLFQADEEIRHVYFPTGAVISLVVGLSTGEIIESAMVGKDGVVGAAAALDGKVSLSRGIVQLAGDSFVCSIEGLKSAAMQSQQLLSLLIRHEQTVYAQAQQSAAKVVPLAAAGARPVGYRYASVHSGISCGNAGRETNQRNR